MTTSGRATGIALALVATALAPGAAIAQPCGAAIAGDRRIAESGRYVVAYATSPSPVEVGRHFVVDFAVCPRDGAAAVEAVRVDATMPEHRHGMNYRAAVTTTGPGRFRAEGLLFHMPGRWDLSFDVAARGATEPVTAVLRVE